LTLTHDTNGNVTGFGTESFSYSSENLLKTGPSSTTLTYDPLTRLYQSVSGATTSRFAYDGLNALAEYNSSNVLQRRWVYEPGGQPILWYEGAGLTNRRFLSADERGSIISTSDSTGAKLAINRYDEYGNPAATNSGRYGYTGQAWLPSVTLWYYKARVYEPQLGRFLQPDPADYSQSPNLYAYVLNDPINLVDPFGLQACSGDSCPRGGIQVVGQRLTYVWWPRTTMLIIDRALNFGGEGGFGGLIGDIGKEVRSIVCKSPAINIGGGADLYAGVGGSLGGGRNLDLAKGRFGISGYTGVGIGLGADTGYNVGLGPSGGGIVSANLAATGGFALPIPGLPGLNVGHSSTYNFLGTDPGYSGGGIGRAGTPLVYGNLGANIGFNTPSLYNLGC
jgi:RHS repeat-associated protein